MVCRRQKVTSAFVPAAHFRKLPPDRAGGLGSDLPRESRAVAAPRTQPGGLGSREADLQLTRMRLVEHFTSVSGHYITDQPEFDRFAEMVQLVEEAIGWIEDRPWSGSPASVPNGWSSVSAKDPVDQRRDDYRRDRRRAVQTLTLELDAELERLMRSTGNDSRSGSHPERLIVGLQTFRDRRPERPDQCVDRTSTAEKTGALAVAPTQDLSGDGCVQTMQRCLVGGISGRWLIHPDQATANATRDPLQLFRWRSWTTQFSPIVACSGTSRSTGQQRFKRARALLSAIEACCFTEVA